MRTLPASNTTKLITDNKLNIAKKKRKVLETTGKKLFTLHNVPSTKSILDIKNNNFQSVSPNITKTAKQARNDKLAKHFHQSHNIHDNLNIAILQNNIKTAANEGITKINGFSD